MARPNFPQRQNVDRRENNSQGHDVKWNYSVRDLLLLQTWALQKNYRTLCEKSPSSWCFKMELPEVRDDGTSSMYVRLERTDSLNIELEACIWLDFCDPNENLIFPKQTFTRAGMLPGDVIEETVEMTSLPNMRDAIRRNAVVFVTLMICFCHNDSESD